MLWCLPGPFRHEYGAEMVRVFSDDLDAAPSARAVAGVWIRSLGDLALTAPQEHYHVMKQNVRYVLRTLAAQPGFTAVAVLSLALGIGANVAIFSLQDAVLYRALPVERPEELVMLTDPAARGSGTGAQTGDRDRLTYQEFLLLRDQTKAFTGLMASQAGLERLQMRVNGAEPEDVRGRLVSAEYFETLGVKALLGRAITPRDGARTALAVISHDFWERRFGARADAVGARLDVRLGSFTIAGVMPPSFFGETVGDRPDVWLPLDMQPVIFPGGDWLNNRTDLQKVMWLHAFGRLRPGVSIEQAQAEANVVFQQELAAFYAAAPNEESRKRFMNQRLRLRMAGNGASSIRGAFGEPLTLMLGAAVVVLLIACANLGNLMLARATARTRELAVRLALGAGRGDLIRQMLTESLVIALAGGVVGLGLAVVLRAGLLALAPRSIQLPEAWDAKVALFAFALTLGAGLLLGLLPALRAIHVNALGGLREQSRGNTGSAAWLRTGKLVVAGQVALSLPLVVGSLLLVRTLQNLQRTDLGYAKENLLMLRSDVERAGYEEPRRQALFERLLARVRATPGVRAATYSNHGLLMGGDTGDEVAVEGYTATGSNDRGSNYEHIGPDFFSSLGIPILLGREISARDHAASPRVCVINEAFAKRFFANRNPIGQHVTQIYGRQRNTYEVVGVVANFRKRGLRGEIEHRYFVPAAQPVDVPAGLTFAIRTSGDPMAMTGAIRRAILAEDPQLPVNAAVTIETAMEERTAQDRLLARLAVAFGVVALLLAAIGLYGVLSYGVARRTSEIGIRKALGAGEGSVMAMILRESGGLVLGGLLLGVALALGSLRWIESRLYGLASTDAASLAGAIALLSLVALVAAWVPARRASRVDPLIAIRYE